MKKIILSAAVFIAAYGANAQGLYGELSVGYGLGNPAYVMGTDTYKDLVSGNTTEKPLVGSVGQGFNVTLTPGYMFSKHFGVELGINYFMGAEKTISESRTSNSSIYSKTTAHSNQFRLIPTVVVSSGGDKLSVFAKGGLMLPLVGSTKVDVDASSTANMVTYNKTQVESTVKGNVSLGFRGAVGVDYKFSEKLSIFGEVFHTSLFIKQKSRTIDTYTVNGTDQLATTPVYGKETNYVDELNANSNVAGNAGFNQDKAKDELAGRTNFNQVGLNIGVKFNF